MKRFNVLIPLTAALFSAAPLRADVQDTLWVSDHYTVHVIFGGELGYADLSNTTDIAAKIVEQSKNKLAIKARHPFKEEANVSVEEANGDFHTYIVAYSEEPPALIIDTRPGAENYDMGSVREIEVSDQYTTHLIFSTDVNYADLSQPAVMKGSLVEAGKNKVALMARAPFEGRANISLEEANGVFHTYLLRYAEKPAELVIDTKEEIIETGQRSSDAVRARSGSLVMDSRDKVAGQHKRGGISANTLKKRDAPVLSEVVEKPQSLYHAGVREHKLTFMCENIFSYSDITYIVLSLKNDSGISFEAGDVVFIINTMTGWRRKVADKSNLFPKNHFGTLTVPPHSKGKIAYTFDKTTLSKDQCIQCFLYEENGNRHLVLTLTAKDINGAISPYEL